jgi:thymidylate synthase (FAD)
MTHTATLVHITPNAEELISYMARVSNPSNQNNTETSARLIKYLIDHKHWSPFEMVNMCVSIETTRSIAAQILRHRSFSFQEFSQRYAEVEALPIVPELRKQDFKNRQNSIEATGEDKEVFDSLLYDIDHLFQTSIDVYNELLKAGVAKECAREVLPLSTPTRLYMNGTIRSWLHYVDLRTSNGTQKEHALIAAQIQDILYSKVPNVCEAMWSKGMTFYD